MNSYDATTSTATRGRLSLLKWLGVVVSGALSVLGTVAIVGDFVIFWSLPKWPNALWQWFGLALMTFALILFAVGMGWTSSGILFQNRKRWRRGMLCVGASVLCYAACVAFAITMRVLYPDTFPFGQGAN